MLYGFSQGSLGVSAFWGAGVQLGYGRRLGIHPNPKLEP